VCSSSWEMTSIILTRDSSFEKMNRPRAFFDYLNTFYFEIQRQFLPKKSKNQGHLLTFFHMGVKIIFTGVFLKPVLRDRKALPVNI
ncbi:MAG: hypothetical protein J6T47_03435, partial [Lachnospiraceae bacterium]|nr:hypothetical protein [Lachnospiraceae bacterium]